MPSNDFPSINRWSCSRCSFEQSSKSYPICEICHQVDSRIDDGVLLSNSSKSSWKCPSCTWENKVDHVFCESCYQTKPSARHHELDFDGRSFVSLIPRTITIRNDQNQSESNPESQYQQIISNCRTIKTHFVDDQFIPSIQSLGSNNFNSVSRWLRISDISPSSNTDRHLSWSVISSPQPADIEQGALGNCWLMAALALITERPRILRQILLTQTVNDEGIYLVRICHNGLWRTIIVDDCFPCTYDKKLVFSQAKRRQLYVPLIEKACAKLFSSYASLTSGNMRESLQLLTGAPCDHINLQVSDRRLDVDLIWAKLLSACGSNLLIGASSGRTDIDAAEYARVHIHSNHAFSILAVHTLASCSSRFVLVRDPHARWNYTDEHVTPTVLDQLQLINNASRSSGAFWISWPTFLRFFASVTISSYNEDHFDVRHEGQFTRSSNQSIPAYRFRLTETSLISISLMYHRPNRKTPVSHTQSFVLCDIDEESSTRGIGRYENILKSRRGGFTYWTGSLRPGNYVLIPFSINFWAQDASNCNYTVVIHSSIPIDLTIAPEPPTLLTDCLISAIVKKYHVSSEGKDMAYYVSSEEIQSMFLIIENRSSSDYLTVKTSIPQLDHTQLSRDSSILHDCIPPNYRQLIFMIDCTEKYRLSTHPTYTVTFKHTKHAPHAKSLVNNYLDDLHTPRVF